MFQPALEAQQIQRLTWSDTDSTEWSSLPTGLQAGPVGFRPNIHGTRKLSAPPLRVSAVGT